MKNNELSISVKTCVEETRQHRAPSDFVAGLKVEFKSAVMFLAMFFVLGMTIASAQTDEMEIVECCTLDQIENTEAFHGRGVGESINQQQAREKARAAAIQELGGNVNLNLKSYSKIFRKSLTVKTDEEYLNLTKSLSQHVVDQNLSNIRTVCEKGFSYTTTEGVNKYKYYIMVESDKDVVEKEAFDGLKQAGALNADVEYYRFQTEFDKVFEDKPECE